MVSLIVLLIVSTRAVVGSIPLLQSNGALLGTAISGAFLWMVLVLPFMFTCGMVLADTIDGVTMCVAYGWAFLKPMRKIYYNLTITIVSILVALSSGRIEVLQVFSNKLNLTGGFWNLLNSVDFETMGIASLHFRSFLDTLHRDIQVQVLRGFSRALKIENPFIFHCRMLRQFET